MSFLWCSPPAVRPPAVMAGGVNLPNHPFIRRYALRMPGLFADHSPVLYNVVAPDGSTHSCVFQVPDPLYLLKSLFPHRAFLSSGPEVAASLFGFSTP